MIRRPPRSTRTDTLFPYTTLFRSGSGALTRPTTGFSRIDQRKDASPLPCPRWPFSARTSAARRTRSRDPRTQGAEDRGYRWRRRSEEHTSELQSLMRISYAVFCLKKKKKKRTEYTNARVENR